MMMAPSKLDALLVAVVLAGVHIVLGISSRAWIRRRINALLSGFDPFAILIASTLLVVFLLKADRIRFASRDFALMLSRKGPRAVAKKFAFKFLQHLPSVQAKVKAGTEEASKKIQHELTKDTRSERSNLTLREKGMDKDDLLAQLDTWSKIEHTKWDTGKVSGAVYHGGDELTEFACKVYARFALSNPLHPDLFPYVRKMEAEIIAMTLNLFHGDPESACGTISSGGTESILLACKAYRDRAFQNGITRPEMIAPISIHAAFEKAAQYFGIKLIHSELDPITMAASVSSIRSLITCNTILVAASAPCFPYGIIDPIAEIAQLARHYGLGFHVDCCLGSYLVPFLAKIGRPVPPFDFSVPGVTSISCDLHKYGFAPKGISCIMYHSADLRQYQYFASAGWTGGIYASPTLAGSRPGALSACAWATMMALGQAGYTSCAQDIMDAADVILSGLRRIQKIRTVGDPKASVIAFVATDPMVLNIYNVNEAMAKKGWSLNCLQNPAAMHICVTNLHRGEVAQKFVDDLASSVKDVISNPDKFSDGAAAVYGMAATLPDVSIIDTVAKAFVDGLFMS